jgi:hypothetical protein
MQIRSTRSASYPIHPPRVRPGAYPLPAHETKRLRTRPPPPAGRLPLLRGAPGVARKQGRRSPTRLARGPCRGPGGPILLGRFAEARPKAGTAEPIRLLGL